MDDTLEVLMDRRLCWPGEDVSAQTHRRWRRRFWCVYCTLAWPTLSSPVTALPFPIRGCHLTTLAMTVPGRTDGRVIAVAASVA